MILMSIIFKKIIKNSWKKKLILKPQQSFRSENHNVFTEEGNKIALSANHDKRMQSIDSMEKYTYGTSKDLLCIKKKLNITI